jgi:hypothetical protein
MRHVANRGETAARCLRAAADLELQAGALFGRLAAREGTPGWLAELLRGLAREEDQHAMRIRLAERLVPFEAWPEHALTRIAEDLRLAQAELLRLEVTLERPGVVVPRAVLEGLLAAEQVFDALHAEMMTSSVSLHVNELFRALRRQDAHHRELMRDARASEGP